MLIVDYQPKLAACSRLRYCETAVTVAVIHKQHRISVCIQRHLGARLPGIVHQLERFRPDHIVHCRIAGRAVARAGALPVVGGALLRIIQYGVGGIDFRKRRAGVRRLGLGRVIQLRQAAISGLDDLRLGGGVDLQDFVEVGGFGRRH